MKSVLVFFSHCSYCCKLLTELVAHLAVVHVNKTVVLVLWKIVYVLKISNLEQPVLQVF